MALAVGALRVGHPQIAVAIDCGSVREDEHALAKRREQLAAGVVFQNRRFGAVFTRVRKAAVNDVDDAVRRRLDRGDRRPFHVGRQLAPVARRAIGLRQIVSRRTRRLRNEQHARDRDDTGRDACLHNPQSQSPDYQIRLPAHFGIG